jgi:hypothetical protein
METKRWFNPSQPQTLQIAVWLLYFNAIFGLLLGSSIYFALGILAGFASLVGCAAAAFGIANEKRWGYLLGVVMAILQVLLIVGGVGLMGIFQGVALISFLFAVALVALLLHPMSREYQRIWFR